MVTVVTLPKMNGAVHSGGYPGAFPMVAVPPLANGHLPHGAIPSPSAEALATPSQAPVTMTAAPAKNNNGLVLELHKLQGKALEAFSPVELKALAQALEGAAQRVHGALQAAKKNKASG